MLSKNNLFTLTVVIFLILSVASIMIFNPIQDAKWFDDGMDIIVGVMLLYFGTCLYTVYMEFRNNMELYAMLGVFILAFQKIFEIILQEWQVSIGYLYPPIIGIDGGAFMWGLADMVMMAGIILIFLGFQNVIPKGTPSNTKKEAVE